MGQTTADPPYLLSVDCCRSVLERGRGSLRAGRGARLGATSQPSSQDLMTVLEDSANKPHHDAGQPAWLEGKVIVKDHTAAVWRRAYPSLMSPKIHRTRRGLLHEPFPRRKLEKGQIGIVDRQESEEEDPASKESLAGLNGDVRQTGNLGWHGHAEVRPHLGRFPQWM